MIPLTKRQKQAFDFIKDYIDTHGVSPTILEIAQSLGIRSKGNVARIVNCLVERGAVTRIRYAERGITVTDPDSLIDKNYLPLIGVLAAYMRVSPKDVVEAALLEYLQRHPIQGAQP